MENLSPSHLQNLRKSFEKIPSGDDINIEDDDLDQLRALTNSSPQSADLVIQLVKLLNKYYVKEIALISNGDFHNTEASLHVVAYWNGPGQKFDSQPKLKRSVALVNKMSGFLKDELNLQESWWLEKNKGTVYQENSGDRVFDPPPPAD